MTGTSEKLELMLGFTSSSGRHTASKVFDRNNLPVSGQKIKVAHSFHTVAFDIRHHVPYDIWAADLGEFSDEKIIADLLGDNWVIDEIQHDCRPAER